MKKVLILDIILIIINIILFYTNSLYHIDNIVYNTITINPTLTSVFKVITSLSNTIPLSLLFIISIIILIHINKKSEAKNIGIIFTIGACLMIILKNVFRRSRPNINRLIKISGFSYPSGHSLMSFIFYGMLIIIINKNYKGKYKKTIITGLCCIIFLIGLSRIYLGVHYFTDVILGYSIGLLILLLNVMYLNKKGKEV